MANSKTPCKECLGGVFEGRSSGFCRLCEGTGLEINQEKSQQEGMMIHYVDDEGHPYTCMFCKGSGKCMHCKGMGIEDPSLNPDFWQSLQQKKNDDQDINR